MTIYNTYMQHENQNRTKLFQINTNIYFSKQENLKQSKKW